jgi:flagellar M-ring protein FliF
VIILAVVGAVLASAVILTLVLNRPTDEVLFRAASTQEATEAQIALYAAGVERVRITPNNEIIVPSNFQGLAWVAISEAGLPRQHQNNDVWNTGVGMFTTRKQMEEIEKHQLQDWIMTYLRNISAVDGAQVILHIPDTKGYVMQEMRKEPRASISVTLRGDSSLTSQQIQGIYNFVRTAVPDLEERNITLTDSNSFPLIPDDNDGVDEATALVLMERRLKMEAAFREMMMKTAAEQLMPIFERVFGADNHAFSVNVDMNPMGDRYVENEVWTPIEGLEAGILRNHTRQGAVGGTADEGGVIGVFDNGEIAPDFPTVPEIAPNGEFYAEWLETRNYEINRMFESYTENGLRIGRRSATLVINSEPMTQAQLDTWASVVADAIGADPEAVTVTAEVFYREPTVQNPVGGLPGSAMRSTLIYIIISLGVLLIILFVMAITTSSSKRKRLVRGRGLVPAEAVAGGGYITHDSYQQPAEPEGFELESLLDEKDTKDVVLKREIREFSKSNPEIIAQLVRTWLRTDDE